MRQQGLLTLPNVVSLSRLFFALAFLVFGSTRVRLVLLITSAFTDVIDGWIARRTHMTSRSGALIDAISDRVFVLAAVVALVADGMLTFGESLLLLSRDIMTAIGFIVARIIPWLRGVMFKARLAGKIVTILQYVLLAAALVRPDSKGILLAVITVVSIVAVADYTYALWLGREKT